MAAPQSGGGGQSEGSTGILWIIAALFAAAAVIWYSFKKQIILVYFQIKLWEVDFVSMIVHSLGIHSLDKDLNNIHDILDAFMHGSSLDVLQFHDVVMLGQVVGNYYRYPFAVILCVLAVVVFVSNSTRIFKRIYSMKDLVELEQVNYPQITPIVGLDLVKQDIDKGPWAMAMTPMQFCKRHNLLNEFKTAPKEGELRKDRGRIEVALKRGLATKIFAIQLGPVWQGVNKLPPHTRALFAAFAAKNNADPKGSSELLARAAASSKSKLNFNGTDELLKKYLSTKSIQKIINSHAYVYTVMASMLVGARTDGVQASADFLWLKPLDRRLWYVLNTVGRQTPFVEVAGPFAHWRAEREMGRRILVPMVEEATNALEIALKEILYKPDEPVE